MSETTSKQWMALCSVLTKYSYIHHTWKIGFFNRQMLEIRVGENDITVIEGYIVQRNKNSSVIEAELLAQKSLSLCYPMCISFTLIVALLSPQINN
jgi:hypothetical protein